MTIKDTESDVAKVAGCLVMLLAIPLALVTWTYTTIQLWAWFVVPLFGLPVLTFWQAAGLRLTVAAFTYRPSKDEDRTLGQTVSWVVTTCLLLPAVTLGMGWLYVRFAA